MSQIDDATRLRHMLDAARRAHELVSERSREDLNTDDVLGHALVRLLEIVGEAARGVSYQLRERHPEVPWGQIIGFRNRVVHAYFNVDLDIVWRIVSTELEPLVGHLEDLSRQQRRGGHS